MSDADLGPGPRTRLRRLPEKAAYDEATVYAVLDEAPYCHVAALVEGRAMALPTLVLREGRDVYVHASVSNRILRAVLAAGEACVTATVYEGLRLARSGFESSIAYRSVVLFGPAREVEDEAERRRVLDAVIDAVLPGRAREVRPATDAEVRRTLVVRVTIEEASAKVSAGPTEDAEEDQALPIWSGVVAARTVYGPVVASSDGAMAGGLALPDSVTRLLGEAR